MRIAVVVAPQSSTPSDPTLPTNALKSRLARDGYRVVDVPHSLDVGDGLLHAFADAGGEDSVLVYLGGKLRLDGAKSALCLSWDGDVAFRLDAIGALARSRHWKDTLFVLDVLHQDAEEDALRSSEYVQGAVDAIGAREHGFGVVVGARAATFAADDPRSWRFTSLFVDALDHPGVRDNGGAATISRVYASLRGTRALSESVASFAHVKGATDFPIFAAETLDRASATTGSVRREDVQARPYVPSEPPSSGPSLASLLEIADAAGRHRDWDEMLAAYKKALMVASPKDTETRASIYARIGEAKRVQGKPREAELNYEKALAAHPRHRTSYEALVLLATEEKDWARAIAVRKKMGAALADPAAFLAAAETLERETSDSRGAIEALEEARALAPDNVKVLSMLRVLYEKLQRWPKVVEVAGDLCTELHDPKERGELRFAQADVTLGRLRDEARGLSMLDAALEEDPSHEKAFLAVVAVRTRRQDWEGLERTYARLIDRHAERGDVERAWDACKRLGLLRRDQLRDAAGAIDALRGAVRCKPSDVESRAALADLSMARGDLDSALQDLERMSAQAPTRVATFRKLFELHKRAGAVDRAWIAATALEELGAADVDHQLAIEQFRQERTSIIRPTSSLDDDAWDKLVRAPGADKAVADVLRAICRAAAATRVDVLRAQKKLLSLSPQRKQSPTSTVSIVRTFAWASQILGTPLPDLYVYDDVPGGLGAVPGETMATAIGPTVLSGLAVPELAFVVARHLTYYRPEHYALIFFPTLSELTTLFLAAFNMVRKKVAIADHAVPAVTKLRKELEKHAQATEKEELARAVDRFEDSGGKVDLTAWIRGVELTASRAGLIVCGDLAVAMRVLKRESRKIADLSLDDRRADLLSYCGSESFAQVRAALGIAARASMV